MNWKMSTFVVNLQYLVNYCRIVKRSGELCHVQALFEIYNRMQCVRKVTSRVARSTTAVRDVCRCAAPCDEISYDVSYSLSRWPAESFDGDEAYTDIFMATLYSPSALSICLQSRRDQAPIN